MDTHNVLKKLKSRKGRRPMRVSTLLKKDAVLEKAASISYSVAVERFGEDAMDVLFSEEETLYKFASAGYEDYHAYFDAVGKDAVDQFDSLCKEAGVDSDTLFDQSMRYGSNPWTAVSLLVGTQKTAALMTGLTGGAAKAMSAAKAGLGRAAQATGKAQQVAQPKGIMSRMWGKLTGKTRRTANTAQQAANQQAVAKKSKNVAQGTHNWALRTEANAYKAQAANRAAQQGSQGSFRQLPGSQPPRAATAQSKGYTDKAGKKWKSRGEYLRSKRDTLTAQRAKLQNTSTAPAARSTGTAQQQAARSNSALKARADRVTQAANQSSTVANRIGRRAAGMQGTGVKGKDFNQALREKAVQTAGGTRSARQAPQGWWDKVKSKIPSMGQTGETLRAAGDYAKRWAMPVAITGGLGYGGYKMINTPQQQQTYAPQGYHY